MIHRPPNAASQEALGNACLKRLSMSIPMRRRLTIDFSSMTKYLTSFRSCWRRLSWVPPQRPSVTRVFYTVLRPTMYVLYQRAKWVSRNSVLWAKCFCSWSWSCSCNCQRELEVKEIDNIRSMKVCIYNPSSWHLPDLIIRFHHPASTVFNYIPLEHDRCRPHTDVAAV